MTKTRNISDLLDVNGDVKSGALDNVANAVAPTRHSIRPSLNLDFANSKELDPRITFTRASNATYYDGYTTAKAEENLVTYSQEFDNAAWVKTGASITANDTTAPDGTTTAELLYPVSSTCYIAQAKNTNGNPIVISVYAKAQNKSVVYLFHYNAAGYGAYYLDTSDGSTSSISGSVTTGTMTATDVGNGWYRFSVYFSSSFGSNANFGIGVSNAKGSITVTPNSTDGIHLWGAQIEQRDSLTAYTPTTTQPITNYVPALQTAGNNVARFDHNPTTGESLGLLIEESRTNRVLDSEDFDNWSKSNITVQSDVAIAPNGTLTADLVFPSTSSSNVYVQKFVNGNPSSIYLNTIYAKYAGFQWIRVMEAAGNGVAFFDILNGVPGATPLTTSTITPVGNGWFRCSVFRNTATSLGYFRVNLVDENNQTTCTASGIKGVYLWGAQFEAGIFPTSYIKTTASTVTRSADSASMTGTNFSDWYRQDEGSVYAEGAPFNLASAGRLYSIDDGTNTINNAIYSVATDASHFVVRRNGTTEATIDGGTFVANQFAKIAGAYKTNDVAASLDGSAIGTDTSVLLPLVSRMRIGLGFSTNYLNGTIKKLAYYPSRLTNNELVDLTEE
jgi:hypothetical protein